MTPVTDKPKRYSRVFECIACGRLADSQRSDAITCSPACRVWLHRHPERLDAIKRTCAGPGIPVAMLQEANAIRALLPDTSDRIARGEVEMEDVRGDVWRAFWALLTKDAKL
ncbi:MAG TPA: hypothetical protein VF264_05430 [Rhodanobacteraceae bacterium]